MRWEVFLEDGFESQCEYVIFPGVIWIEEVVMIHVIITYVFIVDKSKTGFEESVILLGPVGIKWVGYNITII